MSRPLKLANLALGAALAGAAIPPILSRLGLHGPADALYRAYRPACHQAAARSLFLFGRDRVYSPRDLHLLGADSPRFVGNSVAGWKLALCQRDLGLVAGLLAFGLFYASGRPRWRVVPSSYSTFALLAAPLAVDGLSQLGGQRESTWFLRLGTGLLFGLAAAWLVVPRLDREPLAPAWKAR